VSPAEPSPAAKAGGAFGHLGKALVMMRVMQGLSQSELAARAGIRPNQVSRYETGQVLPQLEQLARLLEALEVTEVGFVLFHARVAELIANRELSRAAEDGGHAEVIELLRNVAAREVSTSRRVREVLAGLV
jgi:transcriptional regulator with XRE-family HTH domain